MRTRQGDDSGFRAAERGTAMFIVEKSDGYKGAWRQVSGPFEAKPEADASLNEERRSDPRQGLYFRVSRCGTVAFYIDFT